MVLAVFVGWGTNQVAAELVAISLTAEVTYVNDLDGVLEGKIQTGDVLSGKYIYDLSTPDMFPDNPRSGVYWHYYSPSGISLNVGGFVFETNPSNIEFLVGIYNRDDSDGYLLMSYSNLALSNGIWVDQISWQLNDYSCTALSSDALPTTAPVLEDWESTNYLLITLGEKGGAGSIQATVTSVELVPEPASALVMGVGLALLRIGGRRK